VKRFYRDVTVEPAEDGWRVMLDREPVKTARGAAQLVPSRALAEALAEEWRAQGEEIDASTFPLRDLADFAIDLVEPDTAAEAAALLRYAETDTLCYRADPDQPLYPRQQELWEPLLREAEARHEVTFERVSGITHRPQSPETLRKLGALVEAQDPFTLAALHTLATLAHSLVVALAALEDGADAETLWAVANCEEEWQADLWGRDAEAEERRVRRFTTFASAVQFARLAGLA
jgi:chaperone required for assembly of F1-ATPase